MHCAALASSVRWPEKGDDVINIVHVSMKRKVGHILERTLVRTPGAGRRAVAPPSRVKNASGVVFFFKKNIILAMHHAHTGGCDMTEDTTASVLRFEKPAGTASCISSTATTCGAVSNRKLSARNSIALSCSGNDAGSRGC